ncbi:Dyp-type peroxidase [Longispora sp. K20-0274]|uniref:Dyp-type peroxidase n=1 Tax=Longispora sp. K20-0274 TaxID=3088255 RepID=UPI00399A6E23
MRRLALLIAVFAALVLLPAGPASAHTVGGVGATNFHTTLSALSPAAPGVRLAVIENGSRLELRNTGSAEVTVRGYADEPYLRVGPDGVYENRQSPAAYLNQSRYAQVAVPPGVSPKNAPDWRKVSDEPVYRWHDHRIHWMLNTLPPAVADAPTKAHRVTAWSITLDQDGRPLTATGTLEWRPGPQPWGWFWAVGLGILAVGALGLLRRPYLVLTVATVAMIVADVVHAAGIALVTPGSALDRIGAFIGGDLLQITCWFVLVLALLALRKGYVVGAWLAAGGAAMIALTSGMSDAPVFWRSSAPFAWSAGLNRGTLAVTVALGFGLLVALPFVVRSQKAAAAAVSGGASGGAGADGEPGGAVDGVGPGVGGAPAPATPGDPAEQITPADPAPQSAPDDRAPADPDPDAQAPDEVGPGDAAVPRRRLVELAGAAGLGGVAGAALGYASAPDKPTEPRSLPTRTGEEKVAFHGPHQAGILSPARRQAQGWIGAFDLVDGAGTPAARDLLRRWTDAARALTAGRRATVDNLISAGLGPAGLTVTVGFGPSFFDKLGLTRPEALAPLPAFPGERLDPARGDGDLGVVIAAEDPLVVQEAVRALTRLAAGVARPRWGMSGFGAVKGSAADDGATQRNLMGFLDGTGNPKPAEQVFVTDGPAWLKGGSYLVFRRIRMLLDDWDHLSADRQSQVIGRRKDSGAPTSGGTEGTPADFGAQEPGGGLVIRPDAHMRLATPAFNNGAAMVRRGFSYADGPDDSGLLFLAWQADPRRGFIPVQRRLADADALNAFIRHETSALFAMPAGVDATGYLGQGLLDA